MRPATAADAPALTTMILNRCQWLEERGLPSWREDAAGIARQAGDGEMWLLEEARSGHLIGCTTVQSVAPPWGWTEQELAEPADYLYTTCTDPAYRAHKPGTLIAWWAVHHAAMSGKRWVRRGCFHPALVRYYQTQHFRLIREVQRTTKRAYLMACPASPVNAESITEALLRADFRHLRSPGHAR
ncbi:GNAT family N-acetyltransferase [Streptomyces sp. WAC 06783]|uniref:GNAT family N-acetyltransferase n=1 Tax=Streptomyces sp. WAC 06783 TaxID=2203211 RepID=UPI0021ADCEB2|nr:GNAT family N-acetyltransferase [Streptomyces sp. WAC 06783]